MHLSLCPCLLGMKITLNKCWEDNVGRIYLCIYILNLQFQCLQNKRFCFHETFDRWTFQNVFWQTRSSCSSKPSTEITRVSHFIWDAAILASPMRSTRSLKITHPYIHPQKKTIVNIWGELIFCSVSPLVVVSCL